MLIFTAFNLQFGQIVHLNGIPKCKRVPNCIQVIILALIDCRTTVYIQRSASAHLANTIIDDINTIIVGVNIQCVRGNAATIGIDTIIIEIDVFPPDFQTWRTTGINEIISHQSRVAGKTAQM